MKRVPQLLVTGVLALAAACGGSGVPSSSSGGSSSPTTTGSSGASVPSPTVRSATTSAAPTTVTVGTTAVTAATTTSLPTTGPVAATSLDEVRRAVVRVVAVGALDDGGGGADVPGRASGFLIDPSGRAVTSGRAVAGADRLDVYVDGEHAPRTASVLGVSACADLAVIQIDGGAVGHLTWSTRPLSVGTEVFAAGYELATAEYTVLDGVVSSADAVGDSRWASPASVVEHSAHPLPGGAGGPVVLRDGTVVAVSAVGDDPGRSVAVAGELARPLVEVLSAGGDGDGIGLVGHATVGEAPSGIRVASVRPGSPADEAGLLAGDLLLSMGSVRLASDGTMGDYCDIVRRLAPGDALPIEVYRADVDVRLEGELHGRPLEVVTSFATELDEIVADDPLPAGQYVTIADETGAIAVDVPAAWGDVDRRGWLSDLGGGPETIIGPALSAAPDLAGFRGAWGTPGVFVGVSARSGLTPGAVLDALDFTADCAYEGRREFGDATYTGHYDLYTACGADGSVFVLLAVEPPDGSWLAMIQVVARSEADLDAVDRIVETLAVGDLDR